MTQKEIVTELVTQINKYFKNRPLLINVSGCTGAGKSTWAKLITDEFCKHSSSIVQISEDEFLQSRIHRANLKTKIYDSGEWQGRTHFENHDNWLRLDKMKSAILCLKESNPATYNPYYRETGDVDGNEKIVKPVDLVIFETSIFSKLFDIVIFIEVDDDILLQRKIERDRDLRDEKND